MEPIVSYSFWYMENWLLSKPFMIYICKIKVYDFYIHAWIRYIFVKNCDFIYMIMNNLTMNWFWYPTNGGYSLVLWYPNQRRLFIGTLISNQWGLFVGILIPKPIGGYSLVLWYPANESYSLVFWYPNQWRLFIGILIPS